VVDDLQRRVDAGFPHVDGGCTRMAARRALPTVVTDSRDPSISAVCVIAEGNDEMTVLFVAIGVIAVVALVALPAAVRIFKQYERGVQFRLGRLKDGARGPGLVFIIPLVDRIRRVSLRIVTMPIQSQGIITRDNVSVDIAAVAYYRIKDAVRSVIAIEDVRTAINQIAQTTLRSVVGQHTLDETLAETDKINQHIREILDVQTEEWGVEVTLVELKDIQLPDTMKRAMAKQAEAEREKRAKIIAAEGEALAAGELANASDIMMDHPIALQLRNLQTLIEISVDKNSTVVFPAPLMSTIHELGSFLAREVESAANVNSTSRTATIAPMTNDATQPAAPALAGTAGDR
jgi:regulator of protease activity HflC (stomatin/prohibitin superfamily)